MHTHKKLLVVLTFVLSAISSYAQDPVRDHIKTLKIAFITEQLGLSPKEAQAFWPVYNQYEEKQENFRRKEHLELKAQTKTVENMTPEAASALLEEFINLQKEKYEAEQNFITKISPIISPQKTLLLLEAEKAFKKRLFQQYRKRHSGG